MLAVPISGIGCKQTASANGSSTLGYRKKSTNGTNSCFRESCAVSSVPELHGGEP